MPAAKNTGSSLLLLTARTVFIVGVFLFSNASFSQEMRPDVPGVIKPSDMDKVELSPYTSIRENFVEFYAKKNKPSMTIFWNKKFSDQLTTEYEDYLKFKNYEVSAGGQIVKDGGRPQLVEQIDWAVEGPFTDELITVGVNLIDRAMIMRTLNKGDSFGKNPDVQAVEIKAFLGKVDWLVEVLVTDKINATSNLVFRISITEVSTGKIISRFTTEAIPWRTKTANYEFVATSNGFQKVERVPEPVTYEEVGEKLAIEFMAALLQTK